MKDKEKPVEKTLAPDGYHAVAVGIKNGCDGCVFIQEAIQQCGNDRPCCGCERRDNRNVIFVPN